MECIHELDTRWCAACKEGPKKLESERRDYIFNARYEGQCPECDLPITVGQRLMMTTRHRVIHSQCLPVHAMAVKS